MKETSTKQGLWGTLRTVRVPWGHHKATGSKTDARSAVAVAATAGSAVLDPPAGKQALERNSVNGGSAAPRGSGASDDSAVPPRGDSGLDFGYLRGLEKKYRITKELGKGGNGVVRLVEELATGQEFALKSIPKVLTDPQLSDA